jgi:hypothetical protein
VKLSDGAEVSLPTKPANLLINENEAVVVETPGSGGYGKPQERNKAAVENDFASGKFSRDSSRSITAWSRRHELRRNRHRRGHQRGGDRISPAQGRREDAADRARRAGERRHRQERRDHPSELFDSPARSPGTREHHDVTNAKAELGKDAGFVQDGYCFVVSADMLDGAKKNIAMQKSLGIVNEWSEGPGFRSICLRSTPTASPASSTSRTAATPIRCRRPRPMWVRSGMPVAEFRARTPVRRLLREGDRIPASSSTRRGAGDFVVNAAGPWARPLAASAGHRPAAALGARAGHRVAGAAGRAVPKTSVSMGVDACYYRRSATIASSSGAASRRSMSTSIPITYKTQRRRGFHRRRADPRRAPLPAFSGMKLIEAYAALYDVTPDWYPIVGRVRASAGYADFSGGRRPRLQDRAGDRARARRLAAHRQGRRRLPPVQPRTASRKARCSCNPSGGTRG